MRTNAQQVDFQRHARRPRVFAQPAHVFLVHVVRSGEVHQIRVRDAGELAGPQSLAGLVDQQRKQRDPQRDLHDLDGPQTGQQQLRHSKKRTGVFDDLQVFCPELDHGLVFCKQADELPGQQCGEKEKHQGEACTPAQPNGHDAPHLVPLALGPVLPAEDDHPGAGGIDQLLEEKL